ncbi:hypothetical protein NXS19_010618 [Fusarium pseudograminearum]|nr:hypothetical protein NXS19_010618 [Fusarium pseudograminearum]
MSASNNQQKRKRNADDETMEELNRYKNKPLSPNSKSVYSKLVYRAHQYSDAGYDEELRAFTKFFVAKQDQNIEANKTCQELNDKVAELNGTVADLNGTVAELNGTVAKLESDGKEMKASLDSALESNQEVTEELNEANLRVSEYEFMFKYGDWLKGVIDQIKAKELDIQAKQTNEICNKTLNDFKGQLKALKAGGVVPTAEQLEEHKAQKDAAHKVAKKIAKWSCLKPTATEALMMINGEIDAVKQWLQDGGNETSAPGTPYLDRIAQARICQFWKKVTKDGEEVYAEVPNKELNYTCINWKDMRDSMVSEKSKIQDYFTEGKISQDVRDCFVSLVDQYWQYFCIGESADGNLILTQDAKDAAKKSTPEYNPSVPPKDFLKEYKEGKWDDIQ